MTEYSSEFISRVAQSWPIEQWGRFSVVAAVSGGADSVAMLRSMHEIHQLAGASGELIVAHVDHGVRAAAGREDAQWVADLAKSLGLKFAGRRLEGPVTGSSHQGQGPESLLRADRYTVLEQVAAECGARFLLTGHTADDQVETVLFRILRGTGPEGLAGIPRSRQLSAHLTVYRPLLQMTHAEVLQYLSEIGQEYREDLTNVDPRFSRNKLRHTVLPMLRQQFGEKVDQSIRRLARLAGEQAAFIDELALPIVDQAFRISSGRVSIDREAAQSSHPVLLKAALRKAWQQAGFPTQDMTADKWNWLAQQLCGARCDAGITTLPGNVAVQRESESLVLTR